MGSWKLETDMDAGALPGFLRRLAEAMEKGAAAPGEGELSGLPTLEGRDGLRKLVLVAEHKDGGLRLRLKAKRGHELRVPSSTAQARPSHAEAHPAAKPAPARGGEAQAKAREKYRQLKKLMQADYKTLRASAQAGAMPAQDALESFLALGESMVEMPQPLKDANGPEARELARANAAFLEDARALRRAVSARDAAAFAEVLERLERRKSACHAQFK
ncbi:MAG TPA: GAK system XXXCH domain-containing protein [Humidesulfovibrio sp.]|uniref:GAK system XXXCH domain-containing protein n=1 Tax=Humidesulfovibrio sp. TaxID=2910988 RepID=UPI002B94C42E|nr:GAK system XXXCH domain-containing protein [Humidesulfovibrio sp.]HWR03013.1 GAK system XXXCH domain-containing protein [Humidesulfovibrio sp.]